MENFLVECHQVEMNAGKTYAHLAANGHYPDKLRAVFDALSADERKHARALELAMQADWQALNADAYISWGKVREAQELSARLLQQVKSNDLLEEQALRLAIQMEQAFVKIHLQNALTNVNDDLARLFQELETDDKRHIETLEDCLTWWQEERAQR